MAEKNFNINMKKITAVLCIIAAVLSICAFIAGDAKTEITLAKLQVEAVKEEIITEEEYIVTLNAQIEEDQKKLEEYPSQLATATEDLSLANDDLAVATDAVTAAEANLDTVCYRSYYSYYYCKSTSCKSLHQAVTNAMEDLDDAEEVVSDCQSRIDDIEKEQKLTEARIAEAEEEIVDTHARIDALKEELSTVRGKLVLTWLGFFGKSIFVLLVAAALGFISHRLFSGAVDKFVLFSCLGLAAASLIFITIDLSSLSWLSILFNVHGWNLGIMACFYVILSNKLYTSRGLRLLAVLFAVSLWISGIVTGNFLVAPLYAIAMICLAFIIVPLDYTEYISIYKHIFLSLITFGVWQLVWIYFTTKNLNKVSAAEDRNPSWELLLCILLPFYYLYWLMKTADITEAYGEENGKSFKLSVICVVFALICPLFSTVMIQDKINVVAGRPE